jgi:predicted small metal-binding protein
VPIKSILLIKYGGSTSSRGATCAFEYKAKNNEKIVKMRVVMNCKFLQRYAKCMPNNI